MIEHYVVIKQLHIGAVMASGALFFVRGVFVQAGATWPMIAPLRYVSYAIDTVLLSAAIPLLLMLPSGALANGWLLAKLSLLVAYIVIGSIALKRGRTPAVRRIAYVSAVLVFLFMYAIARTHDPRGPLLYFRGSLF
ncbi:MAG: SirB2 family protein [Pseudomonadota bacterium]